MIKFIYPIIFLTFLVFSCQKNATQKNNIFISESEFVGTAEQFQEYRKIIF